MATGLKRQLEEAVQDAHDFRSLFPRDSYERWEIGGSVRRGKAEVGDIEHVIIPAFGEAPGDGIFGEPVRVNLLWRALDEVMARTDDYDTGEGIHIDPDDWRVLKAIYTDKNGRDSHRWGDKYRGVLFRGFKHELFTATPNTWGSIFTIRTGPAEFSQRMVTELLRRGLQQKDGQIVYARGASAGQVIPCPTEERFFDLCGQTYLHPAERTA